LLRFYILYLLLLIFKQEKLFGRAREGNLGSRRIFPTVLVGHKKTLSGPIFAHPCARRFLSVETPFCKGRFISLLNVCTAYRCLLSYPGWLQEGWVSHYGSEIRGPCRRAQLRYVTAADIHCACPISTRYPSQDAL
jgi:hypothetical protein